MRTEDAYAGCVRRFIRFHGIRHPLEMGESEIRAYLTHLAVDLEVAPATQNQALNASVFLYKQVLQVDPGDFGQFTRAKTFRHLPVVLTHPEANALIDALLPPWRLMALLLYGAGLRLMECLRLRVKDINFGYRQICVRDGKDAKDRITLLPASATDSLKTQLSESRLLFALDRRNNSPGVEMLYAFGRKYPNAAITWGWFWIFHSLSVDPPSGSVRRHHLHETVLQRAVKGAVKKQAFTNHRTPCAIPAPLFCHPWKAATTSAPCRNSLAIRRSP